MEIGQTRGYITSTPKSDKFPKKRPKTPKNERASCMPVPKNGERPYLAVSKTLFRTRFLALFLGFLLASDPAPITPHHYSPNSILNTHNHQQR